MRTCFAMTESKTSCSRDVLDSITLCVLTLEKLHS